MYTTDLDESMRAVNELEAGMVWVNAPLLDNDAGPFGGRKQSGMGRQLGAEGLDRFRHTKLSMIDHAAKPHDFWWFPYSDAEAYPGGTGADPGGAHPLPRERPCCRGTGGAHRGVRAGGAAAGFRRGQLVLDDALGRRDPAAAALVGWWA